MLYKMSTGYNGNTMTQTSFLVCCEAMTTINDSQCKAQQITEEGTTSEYCTEKEYFYSWSQNQMSLLHISSLRLTDMPV